MLSEGFDKYVHRWKLAVVQNRPKRTGNRNKNFIRDGCSTALYAAYTFDRHGICHKWHNWHLCLHELLLGSGKIFKNYMANITLRGGGIWNLAQTLGSAVSFQIFPWG